MKNLRAAIALAFLLACTPAFAQWQTPNHSVPIGKGVGVTGFGSAAPSTTGMPFVSQGPSADPAFGTIANSGFAAGAADTYKGSLNGSTVADVAFPNCQSVSTALRYVPGSGPTCGNIIVQTGFDMPVNLGLSVPAPSAGALVINLTQANGSPPSSTNPVLVPFRSTALTTGTVTWSTISAPQSVTIPSGATLGTTNGTPFKVWIFEDYNSGTPELGVATCSTPTAAFPCSAWESTLVTSTTISGSAGTAGKLYTTTGVTLDAVRIIGYCEFSSGLGTVGTWSSACTTLQVFGPGIKKPGDIVGEVSAASGTAATAGANYTPSNTLPTTANGALAVAAPSYTPQMTSNLIRISATLTGSATTGNDIMTVYVAAGTTVVGIGASMNATGANVITAPVDVAGLVPSSAGAPSTTTYGGYIIFSGGTGVSNGLTGTTSSLWGGATISTIRVQEIQG